MKPASSATAEPVGPVDRLCSLTAMLVSYTKLTVYFPPNASEADITTAMPATVLFYRSSSDTVAKPKSRTLGSAVF